MSSSSAQATKRAKAALMKATEREFNKRQKHIRSEQRRIARMEQKTNDDMNKVMRARFDAMCATDIVTLEPQDLDLGTHVRPEDTSTLLPPDVRCVVNEIIGHMEAVRDGYHDGDIRYNVNYVNAAVYLSLIDSDVDRSVDVWKPQADIYASIPGTGVVSAHDANRLALVYIDRALASLQDY